MESHRPEQARHGDLGLCFGAELHAPLAAARVPHVVAGIGATGLHRDEGERGRGIGLQLGAAWSGEQVAGGLSVRVLPQLSEVGFRGRRGGLARARRHAAPAHGADRSKPDDQAGHVDIGHLRLPKWPRFTPRSEAAAPAKRVDLGEPQMAPGITQSAPAGPASPLLLGLWSSSRLRVHVTRGRATQEAVMKRMARSSGIVGAVAVVLACAACSDRAEDRAEEAARDSARIANEAAKDAGRAAEGAARAAGDAVANAGRAADAAVETMDVKAALMADSRVEAGNINVDTDHTTKTVVLKGARADGGAEDARRADRVREGRGLSRAEPADGGSVNPRHPADT